MRPCRHPEGPTSDEPESLTGLAPAVQTRIVVAERSYDELEAAELYCPRCRRAQRVRRHLLLVLPTGNTYEYRCATCGETLGGKEDGDPSEFNQILRGRRISG